MTLPTFAVVLIVTAPFSLYTFLCAISTLRWILEVCWCGSSVKRRFKTSNQEKQVWAIVTGATSGIGYEFAKQLSVAGFRLILVSRSADKLRKTKKEIQQVSGGEIHIIQLNLEDFPSEAYSANDFRQVVENIIGNDELALIVCNAGMSDLARHFTDIPLERNLSLIKLNTMANLAMIQTLMPHLVLGGKTRKSRGGVITVGALTSLYPAPTFAVSSGNKHFIRGFSLAMKLEFQGKLDVMIAHPAAVHSNILSKKAVYGIHPKRFVRNVMLDFCKGRDESYGFLPHEITTLFMIHFYSRWVRGKIFLFSLGHFEKALNRPVRYQKIEEKLTFSPQATV